MNRREGSEGGILEARLRDAVRIAERKKRPHFVGFLDERGAALAKGLMRTLQFENYMLWGGFSGSERVVFGAFPEYMEPAETYFPVEAVTASYRKNDSLTHRDFLGALLHKGVERETLGDILVEEGRAVLFIRPEVSTFLLQQTEKIGRVGIRWQEGAWEPYPVAHSFEEHSAVVASPRLDCITSAAGGVSREKASEWIRAGLVSVNHVEILSLSAAVEEGDILSIRGKGRFVIDSLGPLTKKGRLGIAFRKYV